MGSDWFENDTLFLAELEEGHRYAEIVGARLRDEGLTVNVTPMDVRANVDDRHRFADEIDLFIGAAAVPIDVKSRALTFTGAEDYPYDTAFVDTVKGWDRKPVKPRAIVLVSQTTLGMTVISAKTQPQWTQGISRDRKRGIADMFYFVSRELLRTFDELVTFLREDRVADAH